MAEYSPGATPTVLSAPWRRLVISVGLILVIGTPTLLIEEDWRGRPMLDQSGHLWVLPTVIVAIGFALGGGLAGRGRSSLARASARGVVAGAVAAGILLAADAVRRAIHGQAVSSGVAGLWVEAALLSVAIAALGGALGHLATRPHR